MAKDTVFTLKLEADLRDAFIAAADAAHRPASQVVRELMREFIHRQGEQQDYDAFLHRKVEAAQEAMRAGRTRSHEEVEADFARLRAELLRKADEADG